MTNLITCSMCGTRFDPVANPACAACPLHGGWETNRCATVCCPTCGYSTINPDQSRLVKMFAVLFQKSAVESATTNRTLADVKPGEQTKVAGFSPAVSPARLAHLRAYGLVEGYPIRVVQQKPVTVVQVDYVELALEAELARGVWVEGQEA